MSDHANKRAKTSANDDSDRQGPLKDNNAKLSLQEQKISVLEQRLHELQCAHFTYNLKTADSATLYPYPLTLYTDPVINLEIAMYRAKEQELVKKVLELQSVVSATKATRDVTQIIALKEENKELKRAARLASASALQKTIDEKDLVIKEMARRLAENEKSLKDLRSENDSLSSQIFLLSQALINQSSYSQPATEPSEWDTNKGSESPVLEVESV